MNAQKPGLHPRNRHHARYDLPALCKDTPELSAFIVTSPAGEQTINFADPEAVKALNQALLAHFYQVKAWNIPQGFLCPPVPGRADYMHHLADLLAETSGGKVLNNASVLDIGTGANLIYPLIGSHEYGWRFTGTEVNAEAIAAAQAIIEANPGMSRQIRLRRQKDPQAILSGVIHKNEQFDAMVCNPPFHDSAESAREGNERKRRNLGQQTEALNFGGQQQELWCEGGEVVFIRKMIYESRQFAKQVLWFTTLVSKGDNLPMLYSALTAAGAVKVVKKEMAQGQKQSRFIAWTFLDEDKRRRFAARAR